MDTQIDIKKHKLEDELDKIKLLKTTYYNCFKNLKKYNTICKICVNILNAVSISSLVMTYTPISPICLIIGLASTTLSTIISVFSSSYGFDNKISTHQTTALQYADLYRDIQAKLLKNHLTSDQCDIIIAELNIRLSLIEDSSLPI